MDTATSLEAFEAVKPRINELHHKLLDALEDDFGGLATLSDLVERTGIFYDTARRRMSELKAAGLIENTKETRVNPRGRKEVLVKRA